MRCCKDCCCNNFRDVVEEFRKGLWLLDVCPGDDKASYSHAEDIDEMTIRYISDLAALPHTDKCTKGHWRRPLEPETQRFIAQLKRMGQQAPPGARPLNYPEHQGCVRSKDAARVARELTELFEKRCSECGNGVVEAKEACDRGLQNSDLGQTSCTTKCELPRCGDDFLQEHIDENGNSLYVEACDNGLGNSDAGQCTSTCEIGVCGDGLIGKDIGEECEDGNANDGDGCSSTCKKEKEVPHFGSGAYLFASPGFIQAPLASPDETDARRVSYRWGAGAGYLWRVDDDKAGFMATLGGTFSHSPLSINRASRRCMAANADCSPPHDVLVTLTTRLGVGGNRVFVFGMLGGGFGMGVQSSRFTPALALEAGIGVWGLAWHRLFVGAELFSSAAFFAQRGAFHDGTTSVGLATRLVVGWSFGSQPGN